MKLKININVKIAEIMFLLFYLLPNTGMQCLKMLPLRACEGPSMVSNTSFEPTYTTVSPDTNSSQPTPCLLPRLPCRVKSSPSLADTHRFPEKSESVTFSCCLSELHLHDITPAAMISTLGHRQMEINGSAAHIQAGM